MRQGSSGQYCPSFGTVVFYPRPLVVDNPSNEYLTFTGADEGVFAARQITNVYLSLRVPAHPSLNFFNSHHNPFKCHGIFLSNTILLLVIPKKGELNQTAVLFIV